MPKITTEYKTISPAEAAKILGVRAGAHHIRLLIRKGKLKADRVPCSIQDSPTGYKYVITTEELKRYQKLKFNRGCKRGVRRSKA